MGQELVICDTNIIIEWLKGDSQTIDLLENIGSNNIILPSISIMEILQGARNKNELNYISKRIARFPIIHITQPVSLLAINLIEKYNLSHNLLIPDALIAATSITHSLKLLTFNKKDFRYLKGLVLY